MEEEKNLKPLQPYGIDTKHRFSGNQKDLLSFQVEKVHNSTLSLLSGPNQECNKHQENSQLQYPLKRISSKTKTELKQKNLTGLFEKDTFTFIPYGLMLTNKRIGILAENVKKRGGTVIPFSNFVWNNVTNSKLIVIIPKDMTIQALKSLVPPIFHQEIINFTFVDCEWLTTCLQRNSRVNIEPYCIKLGDETPWQIKTEAPSLDTEQQGSEKNFGSNPVSINHLKASDISDRIPSPGANFLSPNMSNAQSLRKGSNDSGSKTEIKSSDNSQSFTIIDLTQSDEDDTFLNIHVNNEMENTEKQQLFPTLKEESSIVIKTETKVKAEVKAETIVKKEAKLKREAGIKEEDRVGDKRNFMYVVGDDDDEVIFEGKTQKKVKFEESDVKGTFLEDVIELDKINTAKDGEVVELKYFKPWKGFKRIKGSENKEGEEDKKKEFFICEFGMKENLNTHITDEFEKLLKAYEVLRDDGRKQAYDKIIGIIKVLPKRIGSVEDAKGIYGLSTKIIKKIQEILTTGKLKKAEELHNNERVRVLELFNSVWGVGPATAAQFYFKGFRTLEDLRRNPDCLTDWQKIGLKYYKHFLTKVPRENVEEIFKIFQDKIEELSVCKKEYEAILGGSYRRGRILCNDVDIVMTRRDAKPIIGFLGKLVKSLEGSLITDHLWWPKIESNGGETYMGVLFYKGIYHRIDIKIYPRDQFGAAVVYFTGSEYFNRSLRLLAKKKGLTLENYGLYAAIRMKQNKINLQCIPCYSEEDVFRNLGVKYIHPHERDI